MPDPEPAEHPKASPAVFQAQRPWELELLISAGVVFAMLQVPGWLDARLEDLTIHASTDQLSLILLGYTYLKVIAYTLIVTFSVNLTVRGFWVGLIGLRSVFPDGVRWETFRGGPIQKSVVRSHPGLPDLSLGADRVASLTFVSGFLFILMVAIGGFYAVLLTAAARLLSLTLFPDAETTTLFWPLFGVFMVPMILPALIDRQWGVRIEGRPKAASLLRRSLDLVARLFLARWFSHIQYTLFTNAPRRISYTLSVIIYVGMFSFLLISIILSANDAPLVHDYRYFTDEADDKIVAFHYYENLRPPGRIYRRAPSIQSEIVEGPYIKLFLPYSPGTHNEALAELCPRTEPLTWGVLQELRDREPEASQVGDALACLSRLFEVELDGAGLAPDYDFFIHPDTEVRGLVTYLPTRDLEPGRHLLRVVRQRTAEEEREAEAENDPEKEARRGYFIPFWIG